MAQLHSQAASIPGRADTGLSRPSFGCCPFYRWFPQGSPGDGEQRAAKSIQEEKPTVRVCSAPCRDLPVCHNALSCLALCIIYHFLLLALSKDSFCCTGGSLSCVLGMGDINNGANIVILGEAREKPILHFRPGKPPGICSRCFLLPKMHLQAWPACDRAAGKGLACSGESAMTALCHSGLPSPVSTTSRNEMIITA